MINQLWFLVCTVSIYFCSCTQKSDLSNPAPTDLDIPKEQVSSMVDSSTFNLGILLFNSDQGKEFWTEFNTQIRPFWTEGGGVDFRRQFFNENPYLECVSQNNEGAFGVRMTFFKTFFDDQLLPTEISSRISGLSFNALGYADETLLVQVLDVNGSPIKESAFELEKKKFKTYTLEFESTNAKQVIFSTASSGADESSMFGIDDVYLKTHDAKVFTPPASDSDFLAWLKRASFNFFDWNYEQVSGDKGVVLESSTDADKVSISGMGYAYAIFIIAANEGYISQEEAKSRIRSMLNWQLAQNWYDGSGGWHGFPHHYFQKDGTNFWPDVSTIDWAMCAAGIRVVKQYYADDQEITDMAKTLLARPDWKVALAENDKIAMGFDGRTGEMNDYRWALAFSEETELVYLEAVASGDLDASIFEAIVRDEKAGFYPSWFGAGFTYNWLQLWTGPLEPYKANATAAYGVDAATSLRAFDRPIMGLTACSTVREVRENGFMSWNQYISNQGGSTHGAGLGQVIQISPAPYGAALALPFISDIAITALREYVDMGYYHEYLGLPDNVRMRNLSEGITPVANWDPYDINIGPIILAIEQTQGGRIGNIYLSDQSVKDALDQLILSW